MSSNHISSLCKKVEREASSLALRYTNSVEKLENASRLIPDHDEKRLLDLACILSRLVLVKKETDTSIQKLLFVTAFDIKYSGNKLLVKSLADSRAMELLSVTRANLGLLEALIIRADSTSDEIRAKMECSSSPERAPEPDLEPEISIVASRERNSEQPDVRDTSMELNTSFHEELLDTPTIMNRNGVWIKTYNGIHLESSDTRRATAFGRLKRDFDTQCLNIVILEKERNSLLHRADTLELEKLSTEAKYSRLQAEVIELRKTIGVLRRKLAIEEKNWHSRLDVAQLQVSELRAIQAQERLNSSVNLASSK